jgi:hypothetical protein
MGVNRGQGNLISFETSCSFSNLLESTRRHCSGALLETATRPNVAAAPELACQKPLYTP